MYSQAQACLIAPLAYAAVIEDFTLPHIVHLDSTGLHVELWSPHGVHMDFPLQEAQPNYV
jgi:hypothetical protein